MSERARPSSALARLVDCEYGLAGVPSGRDLGGSYNLNLLIDGGFVVRVYGPWVHAERLAAIQGVREFLRGRGWPVAPLVCTASGAGFCALADRLVEVERFVLPETPMSTWPALRAGMPVLARLHDVLCVAPAPAAAATPPIANHIAAARVLQETAPAIATIRGWRLMRTEEHYVRSAETLAQRLHEITAYDLPIRLVHGDFWDNNVYFRGAEPVHIGDFDFLGERARIDDLALTLFFTGEHMGRDEATPQRLALLRDLVDRFDAVLREPLSERERATLPYAIARCPLTFLRGIAEQGRPALAELRALRGPEYDWALRMLDSPTWREAFLLP